jgi:hypothetical protein
MKRLYKPSTVVQGLIDNRLEHCTLAEATGKPVPGVQVAISALANPHEYMAREKTARPYLEPDFGLLEVLIGFSEARLARKITPELLDRVTQMVEVWFPVSSARPDLAARLTRLKASIDLLRFE